jgi:hypothetical protein
MGAPPLKRDLRHLAEVVALRPFDREQIDGGCTGQLIGERRHWRSGECCAMYGLAARVVGQYKLLYKSLYWVFNKNNNLRDVQGPLCCYWCLPWVYWGASTGDCGELFARCVYRKVDVYAIILF